MAETFCSLHFWSHVLLSNFLYVTGPCDIAPLIEELWMKPQAPFTLLHAPCACDALTTALPVFGVLSCVGLRWILDTSVAMHNCRNAATDVFQWFFGLHPCTSRAGKRSEQCHPCEHNSGLPNFVSCNTKLDPIGANFRELWRETSCARFCSSVSIWILRMKRRVHIANKWRSSILVHCHPEA
ncbi:hypothetical protein F0Q53_04035 [Anaplasma marginale]|uniref:Uncharacterized protein n=2 Tax=Anaplasma marginale TaxID=770 RepID=B9KGS7_ANAMF|nr:Hypothetical protein AMF_1052 [Anaplasma marginale str. Florida]AXW85247.1 hypothetical protein BKM88_04070 [Anaplasma marginale]KAA8473710.1 hypothetical protein F0Q53_04035 [Anaplasma marginale]KAB0451940.1 hypothetical protein FY207_02915 [Anaplasma marginale]RCL19741.1 hypothetical protein DOS86_03240 [Anaplasma marginale]